MKIELENNFLDLKKIRFFFWPEKYTNTLPSVRSDAWDASAEIRARKNWKNANLGSFFGGEFI